MQDCWTYPLTAGLALTALLSVALYLMEAPRADQIALWIIAPGIAALVALGNAAATAPQTGADQTEESADAPP